MEFRDELAKIDLLRERSGLSYQEARALLHQVNGDLVEALALTEERVEEEQQEGSGETHYIKGDEIIQRLREILARGNATRIRIYDKDRLILDLPATIGAIGALLAPHLIALGGLAAFAFLRVEVERED